LFFYSKVELRRNILSLDFLSQNHWLNWILVCANYFIMVQN
jgi:hypothetical protein